MKKTFTLLVLLLLTIAAQAQLLWKISGNGLQKPSYIVGTYHYAPVSFTDSIKGLKAAMNTSEQVYGEIIMADIMQPENLQKMQTAMMLPEGQTLDKLFTAEEMTRVNALLKNVLGVDMTNPIAAQQIGRMTPEALQAQISAMIYLKKNPGFNPNESIDGYFQQQAKSQGKIIGAFETIDQQIELLYKGSTMERQKELLLCLADNQEFYEDAVEDMLKAYFSQNLDGIKKVIEIKMNNSCDATSEENERLIYKRNDNWIKQMPAIMKQKATLFVVGAGHLPGERGVLTLLKKAGYTVEGVK